MWYTYAHTDKHSYKGNKNKYIFFLKEKKVESKAMAALINSQLGTDSKEDKLREKLHRELGHPPDP